MNRPVRLAIHLCIALVAGLAVALACGGRTSAAEANEAFDVWPDAAKAPGQSRARGEEAVLTGRPRPFYQLENVSQPTVSVFLAPEEKRTGGAVLVLPGGGMQRLAIEHEGFEVAEWLSSQGLTAFVLKYRVPAPSSTGLIDAQRAMGLIRQRAKEFGIDPNRLGVMGFSAGGEIAALMATQYDKRAYDPIDEADQQPSRPDTVALIYPGGITGRGGALRDDIASRLSSAATPPMFIVHAFPDQSMNSLAMATALKQAGVPTELHLYQDGGHGFGARDSGGPLGSWKTSYQQWAAGHGFFDKPAVGEFAAAYLAAIDGQGPLPKLSALDPGATLADGYAAQRRVVRELAKSDRVVGFKVAKATAADQQAAGIDEPITAALFRSRGATAGAGPFVADLGDDPCFVETEVGYIIGDGAEIATRINSLEHVKSTIQAIVPVIEMPRSLGARMDGEPTAADVAAILAGSDRFLVGRSRVTPEQLDANSVRVSLTRDGQALHADAPADAVKGGQWENLMAVINSAVDQGYTLRGGDVIVSGALGKPHPAERGKYKADFGALGTIEFELK